MGLVLTGLLSARTENMSMVELHVCPLRSFGCSASRCFVSNGDGGHQLYRRQTEIVLGRHAQLLGSIVTTEANYNPHDQTLHSKPESLESPGARSSCSCSCSSRSSHE